MSIQISKQKRGNDQHAKALTPLYAGQQIAWYNTCRGIWFPTTVKCVLDNNSYLIETPTGEIYQRTCQHLHERKAQVELQKIDLRPKPAWHFMKPATTPTEKPATPPSQSVELQIRKSARQTKPPKCLIESIDTLKTDVRSW